MSYQGTEGPDVITGTGGKDRIYGNGGDDQLYGLGQEDYLYGGLGNDYLDGGAIRDHLSGGHGDDVYLVQLDGVYVQDGDSYYIGYYQPDGVEESLWGGIDEIRTAISTYSLGSMTYTGLNGVLRTQRGGTQVENLTGTSDAGQTLSGNELDNIITGAAGDDILLGKAGADTLVGGLGNDRYEVNRDDVIIEEADGGIDHVAVTISSYTLPSHVENLTGLSRVGQQHLIGNGLDNVITGTNLAETLEGRAGADMLIGGKGHDTYYADAADTLVETADGGSDRVLTYDGHTLGEHFESLRLLGDASVNGYGNEADNSIVGNVGDNILYGYKGSDSLSGDTGADELFGNDGDDELDGGQGDDRLSGGSGKDQLVGGADNDRLLGGDDADELNGGSGNDVLRGDAGIDTVSYFGAGRGVTVSLAITAAQATVGAGTDILSGFENLDGSNRRDTLTGDAGANTLMGWDGNDLLQGGDGDDWLRGSDGFDTAVYTRATAGVSVSLRRIIQDTGGAGVDQLESIEAVIGSRFADRLVGDARINSLVGGGGDDRLIGSYADKLSGGVGDDRYFIDAGTAMLMERAGEGHDVVTSSADHVLGANFEDLRLARNALIGTGNGLDNELVGTAGANELYGLTGNDSVSGGGGNDLALGGEGDDLVSGGAGDDRLEGENGDDRLSGDAGADILIGGDGNDHLLGGQEDDVLEGGIANDAIDGGSGIDRLTGGDGADSFNFDDGDLGTTRAGAERIIDFSGYVGDRIDLSAIDADETAAGDQDFRFIGESGFSGAAGELRFNVVDGNTFVQGDSDGDGAADFFLQLDGSPRLVAADFVF